MPTDSELDAMIDRSALLAEFERQVRQEESEGKCNPCGEAQRGSAATAAVS